MPKNQSHPGVVKLYDLYIQAYVVWNDFKSIVTHCEMLVNSCYW